MKEFHHSFINELGNNINIALKHTENTTMVPPMMMNTLIIESATSSFEMEITDKELEELFDQMYLHR